MTQAFFERLITLKLYQRADRARGRFRTFLLTALDNFVHDQHGRAARLKRGGGTTTTSLDAVDDGTRHQADSDTPATDFDRQWALSVLDAALARLSAQCELRGKGKLFLTLKPYVIEPADHDAYQQLALKLGARPNTVAASVHRLRQRLRDHIRAELADTVQSEAEVDAELAALREALALAAVSHGAG